MPFVPLTGQVPHPQVVQQALLTGEEEGGVADSVGGSNGRKVTRGRTGFISPITRGS